MQNKEVREHLVQIVRQYGSSITEDPPKLQGLLKDLVGQHRREINVLMQALRAGVPEELTRASGPTEITAERLASKLQAETGLELDAARWAVETWGNAMGLEVNFGTAAPDPEPEVQRSAPVSDAPARPQTTSPTPPPRISVPPISSPTPISHPQPSQPYQPQPQQGWNPPPYQQQFQAKKSSNGLLIAIATIVVLGGGGALVWALGRKSDSTDNRPGPTNGLLTPSPHPSGSSATDSPSPTASETGSPPSPSASQSPGKVEDGVYTDGYGMFSLTPPSGWDATVDDDNSGMIWRNSSDPKSQASFDIREFANEKDLSLNVFQASMVANLKDKMSFKQKNEEDFTVGGVKGKLVYGSAVDNIAVDCAIIIVLKDKKVILISIETTSGTFVNAVKPIDVAMATWKWK